MSEFFYVDYRGDLFKTPPEISLNANKFLDFETSSGVLKYILSVLVFFALRKFVEKFKSL